MPPYIYRNKAEAIGGKYHVAKLAVLISISLTKKLKRMAALPLRGGSKALDAASRTQC